MDFFLVGRSLVVLPHKAGFKTVIMFSVPIYLSEVQQLIIACFGL